MTRNIDRWVRAMRDDVTGLANKQREPTAAEVRAAHDVLRNDASCKVVALPTRHLPDRDLPVPEHEAPSQEQVETALALVRQVDGPPPSDVRERFVKRLEEVTAKQKQLEQLKADAECRQREWDEQQAKLKAEQPRLKLVKGDAESAKAKGVGFPPGWAAVSPRRSTWWAFRRAPGH